MKQRHRPHLGRHSLTIRPDETLVALPGAGLLAGCVFTLAPTVTLVDSGELIVAAHGLGVAHPPGFPLYVLLAHLATLVPFGNVAQRVNGFSALCGALTAALVTLAVCEALATAKQQAPQRVVMLAALTAGLLIACSRTLWAYATLTEVYTLHTALLLTVFWLMLRWRRLGATRYSDRWLYGAALTFGLALGVHHVTVALTLPALAWLVYATAGWDFFASRRLLYATLCAGAGLTIYAYLPIAASHSPLLNWGDPRTLQRVWWHVTGRQYLNYFDFSVGQLGTQARGLAVYLSREFGPWWLPLGLTSAAAGFLALTRSDRTLAAFLGLVTAFNVAYSFGFANAEDKDAYFLPTFLALDIAVGCGVAWLLSRQNRVRPLAIAAALLVPLVALAGNVRFDDRSRYFIAHDYVENILRTIEPGGLLLTLDWQVCSPMLYTRAIERLRRDVAVVDINLLRRSWYVTYLRREYPDVMAASRDETDAFLDDLQHWEQDPGEYARDPALTRRIDDRFRNLILAFVRRQIESGHAAYATQDTALARDAENQRLTGEIAATYQLVPQGLVFQLFPDRGFHEPAEPRLETRGLVDGTVRFEADDVVRLKVFPVYVNMLFNRGRYLALNHLHTRAIRAFRQSLAFDPTFPLALRALHESEMALRNAEPRPGE
ncbi:MAG TPA: DUF2723 domain-containing protein [Candidatus Kryptonia bacterium]|nr:DUF2723 domain-containing protein [Candidatus Kryptonia bacterium]